MSVQEAKVREKSNGTNSEASSKGQPTQGWKGEMTRTQALAVSWTGLVVLAMNGQVKFYNDRKNGRLVIVIANAQVEAEALVGNKKRLKLADLDTANTSESVGTEEDHAEST